MRFIVAIVAFVVAAALIGLGLAQRTVFAPASHITAAVHVNGQPRYILIDGAALRAHPGRLTLTLEGRTTTPPFVASARTGDLRSWLAGEAYERISLDPETGVTARHVSVHASMAGDPARRAAAAEPAAGSAHPDPVGSDLWLRSYSGGAARQVSLEVPRGASVLVAAEGGAPAPDAIGMSWPADTATPWTGPLVSAGLLVLLAGVVVYMLALRHLRRSRGPRRRGRGSGGMKMPKPPRPVRVKQPRASGGRRALPRRRRVAAAAGLIVVPALLAGCSPEYWPSPATPVPTPSSLSTGQPRSGKTALPPAVTEAQLRMIVARIAARARKADAADDPAELGGRFAAAALQMRSANYEIRRAEAKTAIKADKKLALFAPIPAGPVAVALPMATTTWPRVVDAIVQNSLDPKQAPLLLALVQNAPRENYQVDYAIPLQPDTRVPDVASADVGTSIVPPTSKLLVLQPDQVAAAYGDVMAHGEKSPFRGLFDVSHDTLYEELGPGYKKKKQSDVSKTAKLTYSYALGKAPTIALATLDSGSLVATYLTETVTIRATQSGAEVSVGDQAAALIGKKTSGTGASTTYGYQLLFYVPPTGSKKKIRLLGFSQGMISATEVKKK